MVERSEIANCLNNQFCEVFNTKLHEEQPTIELQTASISDIDLSIFSPDKILKILISLNINKSAGTDGLHPKVLNRCAMSFASILSSIYTSSFTNSFVPLAWKEANITPIFKKGSKSDPGNYRPISLTSIPCKIMERVLRDRMLAHLMQHNLITNEQHGFVMFKSCITNLLETIDIISNGLSKGYEVTLIFLDFAKAFDKVCHVSLLSKLKSYGFCTSTVNWIKDFLDNRRQRVVLGDSSSDWRDVTSGVPQGSVLGPLLFVIFINDMPKVVKHILKLFADDSKLIGIIKDLNDQRSLQEDIDSLVKWSSDWRMLFNFEKCKVMEISKSNRAKKMFPFEYSMETNLTNERHYLEQTEVEKDLGVHINSNLKFDSHCSFAAKKANSVLGMLRRTFRCWNHNSLLQLYTTFVRPHLEYAAPVWSPYRKKDQLILEKVQQRATKLVPQLKNLKYAERLKQLGLTSLIERRARGDLIQYFKFEKQLNLIDWHYKNEKVNSLHVDGPASGIRGNKHRLARKMIVNCDQREKFFQSRVIEHWNALPTDTINSKSVNQFKNKLDKLKWFQLAPKVDRQ